jgi:hypothetical protein
MLSIEDQKPLLATMSFRREEAASPADLAKQNPAGHPNTLGL